MFALLIAALLAAPSPASAGPDAATISRLDYEFGRRLCQDFYHVVPCRHWRMAVSDVRCSADPDEPGRALCKFRQRIPGLSGTEECTGKFERGEAGWHYPFKPSSEPLPSPFPSLQDTGPTCSATGTPDAAAIARVRAMVHAQLGCSLFAEAERPCPPASARISEVICSWGRKPRLAHCAYRLHAPEEYYCRARFQRRGSGWAMTSYRGATGPRSYEEDCSGPVSRP